MRAATAGHGLVAGLAEHPAHGAVVEVAAEQVLGDRHELPLEEDVVILTREVGGGVTVELLLEAARLVADHLAALAPHEALDAVQVLAVAIGELGAEVQHEVLGIADRHIVGPARTLVGADGGVEAAPHHRDAQPLLHRAGDLLAGVEVVGHQGDADQVAPGAERQHLVDYLGRVTVLAHAHVHALAIAGEVGHADDLCLDAVGAEMRADAAKAVVRDVRVRTDERDLHGAPLRLVL